MFFKVGGLLLLAVFYFCYFLKMFLQKKKGIKTDQMGKNKSGFPYYIEVILKIVTIVNPLVEVISIYLNTKVFNDNVRLIGLLISVIGLVFFILSITTMKDSWRAGVSTDEKTDLVTSGIYQISRNPAFVGFDLVYIGMVMMFTNLWLYIVSMISIIMFHLQIVNVEEPFLMEVFGNEYIEYCKKVNRYLGRKKRN